MESGRRKEEDDDDDDDDGGDRMNQRDASGTRLLRIRKRNKQGKVCGKVLKESGGRNRVRKRKKQKRMGGRWEERGEGFKGESTTV